MDQPYIFEISRGETKFRLEFYDTSSPTSWRLLEPDLVIACYDIGQRMSLLSLRHVVCGSPLPSTLSLSPPLFFARIPVSGLAAGGCPLFTLFRMNPPWLSHFTVYDPEPWSEKEVQKTDSVARELKPATIVEGRDQPHLCQPRRAPRGGAGPQARPPVRE